MPMMQEWQQKIRQLKKEIFAIYFACKHPKVPWYTKILAVCVVGYAFSPIDLIPDIIPILGYLDDLILVPLGIMLLLRMIPADVLAECRQQAESTNNGKPKNWIAAAVIIFIWLLLGFSLFIYLANLIS
ncbi:MAG TPA: DUF1232 domain-containing protein [Oculatellaceae cyanobacterium]|jgi:uncharacterized membrane protein YkvA (DUF1232 family)